MFDQQNENTRGYATLRMLLLWLAAYVAVLVATSIYAGKAVDVIPVLTHLISGFSGAAFAIMRIRDTDRKDDPKE